MHSPGCVSRSTIDDREKTRLLARGNEVHFLLRRLFQRELASLRSLSPRPVHYLLPYRRLTSTFTGTTYATRHIITTTIPERGGLHAVTGKRLGITDRPRWQMTCPSSRSLSRGQESREMVADSRVRKFRPSPTSDYRKIPRPPDLRIHPRYIGYKNRAIKQRVLPRKRTHPGRPNS